MAKYMSVADKRHFLIENVDSVVVSDKTEDGYVCAMYELYHIAQDERFPMFLRVAIEAVFSNIEEGNYDAMARISSISAQANKTRAELNLDVDIYSDYVEAS